MITKTFRIYGANGHRQAKSFSKSSCFDWSKSGDVRILDVRNADLTGTNEYTEIEISRNTSGECDAELDSQITDGLFENLRVGKITEIHSIDPYKVKQLWTMLKDEVFASEDQKYGAHLSHWSGHAKAINLDENALRALIRCYTEERYERGRTMGCFWNLNGIVTVKDGKKAEVKALLKEKGCDIDHETKSQIEFSYYDEDFSDYLDDLADGIKGFLLDGSFEATNDSELDRYYLYTFDHGNYRCTNGTQFLYYPGYERRFVEQLPKEVIDEIRKRS